MVSTLRVNAARMRESAEAGYSLATDVADYLVVKGMPFREAHGVVSRLVEHATAEDVKLHDLPFCTYRSFSHLFEEDVYSITVESSVNARDVPGGTAIARVAVAIAAARGNLEADGAP
jgi:argininosuccinate lyase